MDSKGGKIPTPYQPFPHHRRRCHHHHHHHIFYISPHCPLHRSIMQPQNHSPSCSISSCSDQIPESVPSIPPDSHPNPLDNHPNPTFDDSLLMQNEFEDLEVEEEGDPIFVLTDEWRDFFAKSEAKRKQEKKKAKKGKK